ncbi:MAG: hypothetical protein KAI43_10355 [Candidatus Aureabacteria bacterium]|nr:hypothetical protein [Candidatus Auribacterota bacterium]
MNPKIINLEKLMGVDFISLINIKDIIEKGVDEYIKQKGEKIYNMPEGNKKEIDIELFADEGYIYNQIKDISGWLTVIAIYSRLENIRTKALNVVFPEKPTQYFHTYNIVKTSLEHLGIPPEKIKYFKTINRLRKYNNCFKHNNGKVNAKLSKDKRYKLGKTIKLNNSILYTFADAAGCYIRDLIKRLERFVNKHRK